MKHILYFIFIATSFAANAKEIKDWYRDLKDPPGATLEQYSENKLLPKSFLIKMGLRDREKFTINAPGIKKNGKEDEWNTAVDETTGKLTLPAIVSTNFYQPAPGKERLVWRKSFNYRESLGDLLEQHLLEPMGFVARITMSHKKPDKILRFYEKLQKVDIPPISGKNVCGSQDNEVKNQTKIPYGLWRLAQAKKQKRIFLVEGESSALTLWYHGLPALAFGGATKWHDNYIFKYLKGIKDVYVLMEADTGGKQLLNCLRKISITPEYKEFSDRVKLVVLGQYGDISDMHTEIFKSMDELNNPEKNEQFNEEFNAFVDDGIRLNHPGYRLVQQKDDKEVAQVREKFDPMFRAEKLAQRKYIEDVGDNILSGSPNPKGGVYTVDEIIPSVTLQDYSRKKFIPVKELTESGFFDGVFPHNLFGPIFGVKMTSYKLPRFETSPKAKQPDYYRFRTSMDSAQPSSNRFQNYLFNPDGTLRPSIERGIYGREILPSLKGKSVYFVEGESDTLTMRHYGYPAVGIPGTLEWKPEWSKLFKDVDTIILTVEGDSGGDHFLEVLTKSDIADKLLLIDFRATGKDPSDLHVELAKQTGLSVEDLFADGKEAVRNEINEKFRAAVDTAVKNGIYWRDIKKSFPKYEYNRKSFDKAQNILLEKKLNERELCAEKSDASCPTHQEVDEKYKPWPFIDFYNFFKGYDIKKYFDKYGKIVSPIAVKR